MSTRGAKFHHEEYEEKIRQLLFSLQIPFRSLDRYCVAFVHRSVINERFTNFTEHNERLEFLGDAVLELATTEDLYALYPDRDEGFLTDLRSAMVCRENLAKVAIRLNIPEYLLLSKGETLGGGALNPFILANTFEAFLGAIYLDLGYVVSQRFVRQHVIPTLDEIIASERHIDPKSKLQEISQAEYFTTPTYTVLGESGMDHDKTYTIGVYLGDVQIGTGEGPNKKKGQQSAAENALSTRDIWSKHLRKGRRKES